MPDLSVTARPQGTDRDERETPPELFRFITARTGPLILDVCATRANTKCDSFLSLENGHDGLAVPWGHNFWMNPPYSDVETWAYKAVNEAAGNKVRGVVLVPAATETAWWQVLWNEACEVAFLAPRVRFLKDGVPMGSPPFGSAVFVLGPRLVTGPPRAELLRWKP